MVQKINQTLDMRKFLLRDPKKKGRVRMTEYFSSRRPNQNLVRLKIKKNKNNKNKTKQKTKRTTKQKSNKKENLTPTFEIAEYFFREL